MAATTNSTERKLFILTICTACFSLTSSLLNIEELQSVKYGLEILNKPVLLKESPDVADTVLISSKHGQQYQCELPVIVLHERQAEERKSFTTEEITMLLEPMKTSKCLYHNKGWWTYEFCFGKHLLQYHEEGGQIVGDKSSLGVYESQTDWSQEKIEETPSQRKKASAKRYHSQKYVNGSVCEVTGKARETVVKFFCEKGENDYVSRVDEPASCSYIVTVYTAKLCKHPLFEPPPSQKPKQIKCSPALPEEHYNKYLEDEEVKKKVTEAKRNAKAKAIFAKAEAKLDSEMSDSHKKQNKKLKSLLWPWEEAVEAEDETWIHGNLHKDKMGVSRMDIMKDRKRDGPDEEGGTGMITIMSQSANRKRFPPPLSKKVEESSKEPGQPTADDKQRKDSVPVSSTKDQSPPNKESKQKENSDGSPASGGSEQSVEDKVGKDIGEGKTFEKTWKDSFLKARLQLRDVVRERLRELGVDPDEMEKTFKEKLGGKINLNEGDNLFENFDDKKLEELHYKVIKALDKHVVGLKTAVDQKLGKLSEMVNSMEEKGKLEKGGPEKRVLSSVRRLMKEMDSHNAMLMKKEKALQSALQKQFDVVRQRTNGEVATMKEMVREIEDFDEQKGVGNSGIKETMGKIKEAMARFEDTNRELGNEMTAVKQLNDEIHSKVGKILANFMKGDAKLGRDFFILAAKANLLLGRLLRRSAKLDQEMRNIKNIGEEISESQVESVKKAKDNIDVTGEVSASKKSEGNYKIDKVITKLKTIIKNLDKSEKYPTAMEPGSQKLDDKIEKEMDSIDGEQQKEGSNIDKNMDSQSEMGSQSQMNSQSNMDSRSEMDSQSEMSSESETDSQSEVGRQSEIDSQSDMDSPLQTDTDSEKNVDLDSLEKDSTSSDDVAVADVTGDRIKIRVTQMRSVDEKALAEEEVDGGEEGDMEEMGTERRIKRATQRMERMVKEHLKDAGIMPKGKVRVKIITNKDAIRRFGDQGGGMQILTEQETNQFKDMIMGLLGGSQEAGRERRRQMELESNYNLVWNKEKGFTQVEEKDDEEQDDLESHFVDDPYHY